MKKLALLLSLFVATMTAFGQLTITAETHTIPTDLSYYMLRTGNVSEFDPGGEGEDQVWDLSQFSGDELQYDYVEPSQGLESESFPDANLLEGIYGTETYIHTSDSGMQIMGQTIPGQILITYDNTRIVTPFPFTYQDTLDDEFLAEGLSLINGQTVQREGEVEIVADAYGTLILPFDTLENVLRVRSASSFTDYIEGEVAGTIVDTTYSFYHDSKPFVVANLSILYVNGTQDQNHVSYASEEALTPTSVNEYSSIDFKIFPNPASDRVQIEWDGRNAEVQIFEMGGRQVASHRLNESNSVCDVSDLPGGVYLVKIISENRVLSQKLIVE
jgi:hypothetical protein